jgi:uncharacterized protein with gpF-like domain
MLFLFEKSKNQRPLHPIIIVEEEIEEEREREILNQLEMARKEVLKKFEKSMEEEAHEVLTNLKVLAEKRKILLSEKEIALEKQRVHEREIALKKKREHEREIARKKREHERVVALLKKREEERRIALLKKEKISKAVAIEEEVSETVYDLKEIPFVEEDLYTLSKEEQRDFKNFEIIAQSKPFVLEESIEIKSPEPYEGEEDEVPLEDLPFVETLGVVEVSDAFVLNEK